MAKILSSALYVPGIAAALASAECFAHGDNIVAGTEAQKRYAAMHDIAKGRLGALGDVLKAKADLSAEPLNKLLADAGSEIRLNPWPHDGRHFGAVSLLNAGVVWTDEGVPTKLRLRNDPPAVDAFKLDGRDVELLSAPGDEARPILLIPTRREDEHVLIHRTDLRPEGLDLFDATEELIALAYTTRRWNGGRVDHIVIPMVDMNVQPNLDFLADLGLGDAEVGQARQQVRFGMNHKGARAKVETALDMRISSVPRTYTVDGPFMIAFVRTPPGQKPFAAFSAFVGDADFRAPSESFVTNG